MEESENLTEAPAAEPSFAPQEFVAEVERRRRVRDAKIRANKAKTESLKSKPIWRAKRAKVKRRDV